MKKKALPSILFVIKVSTEPNGVFSILEYFQLTYQYIFSINSKAS